MLPLGTGNDLSRVLGLGSGHTGPIDPEKFLTAMVEKSVEVRLDRCVPKDNIPTSLETVETQDEDVSTRRQFKRRPKRCLARLDEIGPVVSRLYHSLHNYFVFFMPLNRPLGPQRYKKYFAMQNNSEGGTPSAL